MRTHKRPSQADMILSHLKEHGEIDSMTAIKEYGITRLSARIYELRHNGNKIFTRQESGKNRFGKPTTWKRYIYTE